MTWQVPDHITVIAEVGINHNGDMALAKQLIDIAVETGCDAVKFQKRTIDLVYTAEVLDAPPRKPLGHDPARAEGGPRVQPRAVPGNRCLLP